MTDAPIDTPDQLAARHAAADALRALVPLVAWGSVPHEALEETTRTLTGLVARLGPHARASRYQDTPGIRQDGSAESRARNASLWEGHCVFGRSHAHAAPLTVDTTGERVRGAVRWNSLYEGQAGFVHGGTLAGAFDVMLGHAASRAGSHIVTGTLTLRFHRSVPVDAPVELESWLEGVDGRKVTVRGEARTGGELAVEATGLFITVGAERFRPPSTDEPAG